MAHALSMSTRTYNKPRLQDGSEGIAAFGMSHLAREHASNRTNSAIAGRMAVLPSTRQTNAVEELCLERMREFECMSVIEQ